MGKSSDEEVLLLKDAQSSWLRPVYDKPVGAKELEAFAVCKHCDEIRANHAGEEQKCLFQSTTFEVKRSQVPLVRK
jgi:molybdenum cofactor biosynthesis enzyme MoaA